MKITSLVLCAQQSNLKTEEEKATRGALRLHARECKVRVTKLNINI